MASVTDEVGPGVLGKTRGTRIIGKQVGGLVI